MGEAPQNGDGIVRSRSRGLEAFAVDGVEAVRVDLAQIAQGIGHVVPEVVHDSLDRPAVEEVAVRVGKFGLQDSSHAPAGDGVGESQGEHADDRGQEISQQ